MTACQQHLGKLELCKASLVLTGYQWRTMLRGGLCITARREPMLHETAMWQSVEYLHHDACCNVVWDMCKDAANDLIGGDG